MRGIFNRCLLYLLVFFSIFYVAVAQTPAIVVTLSLPSSARPNTFTAFVKSTIQLAIPLQYSAGHKLVLPASASFDKISISETATATPSDCTPAPPSDYASLTSFKSYPLNCAALTSSQYVLTIVDFMVIEPGLYPPNYMGLDNSGVFVPLSTPFIARTNTAVDIVTNIDATGPDAYTTVSFTMSPTIPAYVGGIKLTLPRTMSYQGSSNIADIATQIAFVNNAGLPCTPTVTAFNLTADTTMPVDIEENLFFAFGDDCAFTCATGCSVRIPSRFEPPEFGHVHPGYFTIYPKASGQFFTQFPSVSVPLIYSLSNNLASKREIPLFLVPKSLDCTYNTVMERSDNYTLEVSFDHTAFYRHARTIEVYLPIDVQRADVFFVQGHDGHYTVAVDTFDKRVRYTITYTSEPTVDPSLARIVMNRIHHCPDIGADVHIDISVFTETRLVLGRFTAEIEPYASALELICRPSQVYQNLWLDGYNVGMQCTLDTTRLVQRKGFQFQLKLCSGVAVFQPDPASFAFQAGSGLTSGNVTITEEDRCATVPYQIDTDVFPYVDNSTQKVTGGRMTNFSFNMTASTSITYYYNSQSSTIRAQITRQYASHELLAGTDPQQTMFRALRVTPSILILLSKAMVSSALQSGSIPRIATIWWCSICLCLSFWTSMRTLSKSNSQICSILIS